MGNVMKILFAHVITASLIALVGVSTAQPSKAASIENDELNLLAIEIARSNKSRLPIRVDTESAISAVTADGNVLRMDLETSGYNPSRHMARSTAVDMLCDGPGLSNFYEKGGVIILSYSLGDGTPKNYRINKLTCANKRGRSIEVAQATEILKQPAIIHFDTKRPPTTFANCREWQSSASKSQTNERWLWSYSSPKLEKGEFETTAEFEQRMLQSSHPFANLTVNLTSEDMRYDADKQVLTINHVDDEATLGVKVLGVDSYYASNAFGVTKNVEQTKAARLIVKFLNPRAIFPARFELRMDAATAREFKKGVQISILGKVLEAKTESWRTKPTLEDPTESIVQDKKATILPVCTVMAASGRLFSGWEELLD